MSASNEKTVYTDISQIKEVQVIVSPTEKLDQNKTTTSQVPGAENSESIEIKQEKNPNTE